MPVRALKMVARLAVVAPLLCGCAEIGIGAPDPVATSVESPATASIGAVQAEPTDAIEIGLARDDYRAGRFGLAERHFSRAVELSHGLRADAWLGLAATHDQLGRFDLADKDYAQVEKRAGRRIELLNNRGMSYLMRGDLKRARIDLAAAAALDPDDQRVRANQRRFAELSARSQ